MYFGEGSFRDGEPTLSLFDIGFLRGFGVFDALRTYNRKLFHLRAHLERFAFSAAQIGLTLPYSLDRLEEICTTIALHAQDEAVVKVIATGGVVSDQITPSQTATIFVFHTPISERSRPVSAITWKELRPLPQAKTLNYLPAIMAIREARRQGADEAIFVNGRGELLEATTANLFAFHGDVLITPSTQELLLGITQEVVVRLAQGEFVVERHPIEARIWNEVEEAFLTSTTREILPLLAVDGKAVGKGSVGPRTLHLMERFKAYTQQETWEPLTISRYSLPTPSARTVPASEPLLLA